jgi:DNA-binding NarL/FixJ family response regulator
VLIADDHPGIATSLQRLLSLECDVVATVKDGAALLETAARLAPDVVVADVNMPTVNGLDACRKLALSNSGVKVILLSGMDDPEFAQYALDAGACAFLVKYTLVPAELIATIKRVCAE